MLHIHTFKENLFHISESSFEEYALSLFYFQAEQTLIYQKYLEYLKVEPLSIKNIEQIPFLPVELFKYHQILRKNTEFSVIFESSGTISQAMPSRHFVSDTSFYQEISQHLFEQKYGRLQDFHIFALLPSYLERQNSSLVFMMKHFIEKSNSLLSGFYLHNISELVEKVAEAQRQNDRKILVWGVTFALLELAENHKANFEDVILMETGGMKGRREEMTRPEVHKILSECLNVATVHSEYGMTELLSQAYSYGNGIFEPSSTMKIILRQPNDPLSQAKKGKSGVINIIDLSNTDSCAFIATQDIGQVFEDGTFSVLGRLDNADLRGCNLMLSDF